MKIQSTQKSLQLRSESARHTRNISSIPAKQDFSISFTFNFQTFPRSLFPVTVTPYTLQFHLRGGRHSFNLTNKPRRCSQAYSRPTYTAQRLTTYKTVCKTTSLVTSLPIPYGTVHQSYKQFYRRWCPSLLSRLSLTRHYYQSNPSPLFKSNVRLSRRTKTFR